MPKGVYKRKINLNLAFFKDKIKYHDNGCITWGSHVDGGGYGAIKMFGKTVKTHRLSWIMHYGEIKNNSWVLHKCDNPPCLNPEHLFLGNQSDNMLDAHKKRRLRTPYLDKAKINFDIAEKIRSEYKPGVITQKELGKKYGISRSNVGLIINNINWKE